MGLESWREFCDCIECYQVYTVLSKDLNDITKEEFDYISAIELPTGQEYTKEVKAKFAEIKKRFEVANKNQTGTQNEREFRGQTNDYKKYDYGYDKKKANRTQYKNR